MRSKFLSVFIILGILLIPSIAFAAAAQVVFFSTNETTVLGTITGNARTPAQGGGYFISAAVPTRVVSACSTPPTYANPTRLHDVPEFITSAHQPVTFDDAGAQTVILSWKKKGDATNTRYNFVKHAARTAATSTYAAFVPLAEDEVLELVPLKTVPIADFRALVYGSPAVDGHMDTPNNRWSGWPVNDLDIAGNSNAQGRYDRMKFGGLNGGMFGSYVSSITEDFSRYAGENRNSRILATANGIEWSAIRNPSVVRVVNTAQGFKDAHAAGAIGVMHQIEGAYSLTLENYYELLEQYYDVGYRLISFTHNPNSYTASGGEMSSFEVGRRGFTTAGELALMRLDELGIVFDISHLEDQSVIDSLAIGKRPIVGSHHGARGMFEHFRNTKDSELVAMALSGGMIYQNFYGGFMEEPQSISGVVDMYDYMVALLMKSKANGGADFTREQAIGFLGVGTDYDGGTNLAEAQDASFFYRTHRELLARDYTIPEIKRILGENSFRTYDETQGKAAEYHKNRKEGAKAVLTAPMASGVSLLRNTTTGHCADLTTRAPIFTVNVTGAVSGRVIVDGIVYPSTLTGGVLTADLTTKPLQEVFHVVTFEATDDQQKITRSTHIFYVGNATAVHKIEFMNADRVTFINTIYVDQNATIPAGARPTQTSLGLNITGWSHIGTGAAFTVASLDTMPITRSYRLVPTVAANLDSNYRIAQAKSAIDTELDETFAMKMSDVSNARQALALIQSAVNDIAAQYGVAAVVNGVIPAYTPPVVGTAENPAGVNGAYRFTVTLTRDGGTAQVSNQQVFTIKTTPFDDDDDDDDHKCPLDGSGCNVGFILAMLAVALPLVYMRKR